MDMFIYVDINVCEIILIRRGRLDYVPKKGAQRYNSQTKYHMKVYFLVNNNCQIDKK